MMKKFYILNLFLVIAALCYSQKTNEKNALYFIGGHRLNGGGYELSAGYERLLSGNSSSYSLYTSFNYQNIKETYVGVMTKVSNSLVEVGGRKYFLNNNTSIISPFIGVGAVIGNSHITGNANQGNAYPKTQDILELGGTFSLGSEIFLSNTFSLSVIGKYMYDSRHHIFASFGAKYFF